MSKPDEVQNTMRYVGLASQWMVMLAVAAWLGYKLDHYLGWKAAFVIIFPFVALIYSLWKIVKEVSKKGK
jgi:F0F1-type ATP synthase assembly protein I